MPFLLNLMLVVGSTWAEDRASGRRLSDAAWEEMVEQFIEVKLADGSVLTGRLVAYTDALVTLVEASGNVRELTRRQVTGLRKVPFVERVHAFLAGHAPRNDEDPEGDAAEAPATAEGSIDYLLDPDVFDEDGGERDEREPREGTASVAHGRLARGVETVGAGHAVVNAFFEPSAYGVTDAIDIHSDLLGWAFGPNISARLTYGADTRRIAIEPAGWVGLARRSYGAGVTVRVELSLSEAVRVVPAIGMHYRQVFVEYEGGDGDISWLTIPWAFPLGGGRSSIDDDDDSGVVEAVRVPVQVAWFNELSSQDMMELSLAVEVPNVARAAGGYGAGRFAWTREFSADRASISAGGYLVVPGADMDFRDGDLDDAFEAAVDELDIPRFPFVVFPYFGLRWSF